MLVVVALVVLLVVVVWLALLSVFVASDFEAGPRRGRYDRACVLRTESVYGVWVGRRIGCGVSG